MLVRRKDLEGAIRVIACCTLRKSYSPILECCKIDFCEEGIIFTATDLEVGASVCVPSFGGEEPENSIVVNARKLASLVGKGGNSKEEIQISLKEGKLSFGSVRISASAPVEDFPEILFPPAKGSRVYLPNADFSQAVKFVSPVRAKYSGRYALNGIYLDFRRGRLVASDGNRLHCAALGESAAIPGVIISPRLFKVVVPDAIVIPPPTEIKEADMVVKKITHLFFPFQDGICVTRVIEGDFPKYTNHIPKSCPSRIKVERDALLQSLRRIKHASEINPACYLIADGSLELLAKDEEEGIECLETVPAEVKGRRTKVGVNPDFLYDCIAGLRTETVHIYLQGPKKPILVENNDGWFGLVMPLVSEESASR